MISYISGAFLIPYAICLVTGGVPMFFLEVGIGQFMGEGGISVWKLCPAFTGELCTPREGEGSVAKGEYSSAKQREGDLLFSRNGAALLAV